MLARMWRKENVGTLLVREKISIAIAENSMGSLQKIKNRSTIWSSNLTTGYIPKGDKIMVSKIHLNSCVHFSILHNSQEMKQSKCLPTDECMLQIQYLSTMEYYLATWRNEIPKSFVTTWMELVIIMLNEVKTGRQRQVQHDFVHMWNKKMGIYQRCWE